MDEKEKVYQLQQEIEAQVNTLWLYISLMSVLF